MPANNAYLLRRRQGYYAVVEVPPSLRSQLGRRLKRTLKTTDINVARARRYQVVADLKRTIEAARKTVPGGDTLVQEAMGWRESLLEAARQDTRLDIDAYEAGAQSQGELVQNAVGDRVEALHDAGEARWREFRDIAAGTSLPLGELVEPWLNDGTLTGRALAPRTALERRTAVAELGRWMAAGQLPQAVETVSRRVAGQYVSDCLNPSGRAAATLQKALGALQGYWDWLARRGHINSETANPWSKQAPRRPERSEAEKERPFTAAEVVALLREPPSVVLGEFMQVAALTGLRREEIGLLRVRDCVGGVFLVRAGKTAAATRRVPVHSDLAVLVERRTAAKSPDAFLFDDLPGSAKSSRRTDPIGKAFTYHRRWLCY